MLRNTPLEARNIPPSTRNAPLILRNIPRMPRNIPLDIRSTALDLRSIPLTLRSIPPEFRNCPEDLRSIPLRPWSIPLMLRSIPGGTRNTPLDLRSVPCIWRSGGRALQCGETIRRCPPRSLRTGGAGQDIALRDGRGTPRTGPWREKLPSWCSAFPGKGPLPVGFARSRPGSPRPVRSYAAATTGCSFRLAAGRAWPQPRPEPPGEPTARLAR